MTAKRDLKRRVRERQARTGESYTTALRHVLAAREDEPDEALEGTTAPDATDAAPLDTTPPSSTPDTGAGPDATGARAEATDHVASQFESDEVTDPGSVRADAGDGDSDRDDVRDSGSGTGALTGSRWPDEMSSRPSDQTAPIDVDEAVDLTEAAGALDMRCRVLVFRRLLERADPQRVLTTLRDTLVASKGDPDTELLRKLVFQGKGHDGPNVLTREPRFRQRIEAGFTGVSRDGRILAIHVEGHKGIVTALGALWRNMSTLVLMAPDDYVAKLVLPPGTIQELGQLYGVPIPAPSAAPNTALPTVFLIFNGRRYPITRGPFVIGRRHDSDLQIKDGHISRKHAAVFWQQGAHFLVDLASHAGIDFRGMKIKNKRIEEGDVFSLGEYVLRFTYLETDG